jgi:hypothetical protein
VEIKTQIKPDRLAKFRAAYLANGLNAYQACLAIGLSKSRARANAYKYARLVKLEVQEAMKARGLGAERFTEVLAKLLRSKNERIQLEAMREGLRLLGAYPAPKEDPPVEPGVLSVDFAHLILPGEEPDYHNTHRAQKAVGQVTLEGSIEHPEDA